ncbi:DMT family transporter [Tissierella pigra]|uniref:DMT family transporter n=1 Tax=Tissierella pigra TaxID=2607614 RepID=A0A6N7Y4L2_9FIRM|nr:DMT family transporter [Tissierella pigra]MBU5425052.1 DMT family transporter [Tissierella pigra]MSU02990.1 DMT family transporter [Tissierella pigra]
MIYIILAIAGGFLTILSMVVNASLAKRIGVFQGAFINYIGGLIIILLITMGLREYLHMEALVNIPFYAFLGGALGVVIVASSNVIIPKIPTIYSTLLIFIGQIFTGVIIDYLRLSHVSKGKIIGGLIVVLGILYNSNVDKKQLVDEN